MTYEHHHYSIFQRSDIKQHIPPKAPQTVPLIEDEYGNVLCYTSVPADAWNQWE